MCSAPWPVWSARGARRRARALLAEALRIQRDVGDPMTGLIILSTLAATEADGGRWARAVRLEAAATTLAEHLGFRVWPALLRERDAWLEPARRALGAAAFARAWAAGQALTGEEALAEALAGLSAEQDAVLRHPSEPHSEGSAAARLRSRADRQARGVAHLRTLGALSPRAYAAALGVSVDTALRDLQELVDRGVVQAAGTTRNRRYVLVGEAGGSAIHRSAP